MTRLKKRDQAPYRLLAVLVVLAGTMAWPHLASAIPVPCIICGSTPLIAPGVDGTVSYAVMTGANFNAEVAAHAIGFFGGVPQGTLGPIIPPLPTDFVYLYQPVNDGPDPSPISSWTISGGGIPTAITAGTRLESTLFVDPDPVFGPLGGLVSAGPAGATTGLTGVTGTVNFENGLGDPLPGPVPLWGPCLGSVVAGVNCSDAQADLMPSSVQMTNWLEAPSGLDLDPSWSGSVIWFASPLGPTTGTTTFTNIGGLSVSGGVPVPLPEPASGTALGLGMMALCGCIRRRRNL